MQNKEKKRLLMFHPNIAPYRVDFLNDLSRAFDMRLCLSNSQNNIFDNNNIHSQLIFNPISLNSKQGRAFDIVNYWNRINSFTPDIIMVSEFGIGTLSSILHKYIKRKNYKIISICDDSYNMLTEGNDFSLKHKWARRLLSPFLDDIIVVEPEAEKWYLENYRKGFFFPIIRDATKQRNVYQHVLRNSMELMHHNHLDNKNIFLYVGRFVAIKNIETIIKAFSSLDQKDNVLILVGSGVEEKKLKNIATNLNINVIFFN